jgi:hypothetical protein
MATFYAEPCNASWQGNTFPRAANQNGPVWITQKVSVTVGQAVANNIFNLFKLSANTIVLDGYVATTGLDSNASATATVDVGFLSDANGDGDTDVIDYFADAHACANLGVRASKSFQAGDIGTLGPWIPSQTVTSTGLNSTGYFISAKLLGAVATAAAGTIEIGLLICDKNHNPVSESEVLTA